VEADSLKRPSLDQLACLGFEGVPELPHEVEEAAAPRLLTPKFCVIPFDRQALPFFPAPPLLLVDFSRGHRAGGLLQQARLNPD
jgi:hypothetical protein